MYLKITNESEFHHGLQYHDGLVEDIIPFIKNEGNCIPGGIYFSDLENICLFLNYGCWIREVTIPKDAEVVQDIQKDQWRASKVILSPRKELWNIDTWKWLIEFGLDLDIAFCRVSSYGHLEIVKFLIDSGANIHYNHDSALKQAAKNGHLEIVKFLVEYGLKIGEPYSLDLIILFATDFGHCEIVKYLIESGADVSYNNSEVLMQAAKYGYLSVVKLLVEAGSNIDNYILSIAKHNKHYDVVKFLESLGNPTNLLHQAREQVADFVDGITKK